MAVRLDDHGRMAAEVLDVGDRPKTTQEEREQKQHPRCLCQAWKIGDGNGLRVQDLFRIYRADVDFTHDVLFATSMIHYVDKFTNEHVKSGDFTASLGDSSITAAPAAASLAHGYEEVRRALSRLVLECITSESRDSTDPLVAEGEPKHLRQQLFLNQGVVQAVVKLLREITDALEKAGGSSVSFKDTLNLDAFKESHQTVSLCWRFINKACRRYPQTGEYIVNSCLDLMIKHQPCGVRVIDALVSALTDNNRLNSTVNGEERGPGVSSADEERGPGVRQKLIRFAFESIDTLEGQSLEGKYQFQCDQFLNMLSGMCMCSDLHMYETTCREVLTGLNSHKRAITERQVEGTSVKIKIKASLGHGQEHWKTVYEMCTGKAERQHLEYHVAFITLLGSICCNENIKGLKELITEKEVRLGIIADIDSKQYPVCQDQVLVYRVRTAYCKLFQRLFIGVPNLSKSLVRLVYLEGEGTENLQTSQGKMTTQHAAESAARLDDCALGFILDVLEQETVSKQHPEGYQESLPGQNDTRTNELGIIHELIICLLFSVRTGPLEHARVLRSRHPASHTDGRASTEEEEIRCGPGTRNGTGSNLDEQGWLNRVKRSCVSRLRTLTAQYHEISDAAESDMQVKCRECLLELCNVLSAHADLSLNIHIDEFLRQLQNFYHKECEGQSVKQAHTCTQLAKIWDGVEFQFSEWRFECSDVDRQRVATELTEFVELRKDLVEIFRISNSRLSYQVLTLLVKLHSVQASLTESVQRLVYIPRQDGPTNLHTTVMDAVLKLRIPFDVLSGDTTHVEESLRSLCALFDANEGRPTDHADKFVMCQKLMFHSGILALLRSMVENEDYWLRESVMRQAFCLIAKLADANPDNQKELEQVAESILIRNCLGRGWGETDALDAIFSGNLTAAENITAQAVQAVVNWAGDPRAKAEPECGARGADRHWCLAFLERIVAVNTTPVRKNQNLVVHELLASVGTPALDLEFWTIKHQGQRQLYHKKLLEARGDDDLQYPQRQLRAFIQLMHLLAACAEGNNKLTSRKLRTIMPLKGLVCAMRPPEDGRAFNAHVVNAVQHFITAVYIAPIAVEPSLAKDMFMTRVKGKLRRNGDLVSPLAEMLDYCVGADSSILQTCVEMGIVGDTALLLFPTPNRLGGGTITLLTSLFESGTFDTLDREHAGSYCELYYMARRGKTKNTWQMAKRKIEILKANEDRLLGLLAKICEGCTVAQDTQADTRCAVSTLTKTKRLRSATLSEGIAEGSNLDGLAHVLAIVTALAGSSVFGKGRSQDHDQSAGEGEGEDNLYVRCCAKTDTVAQTAIAQVFRPLCSCCSAMSLSPLLLSTALECHLNCAYSLCSSFTKNISFAPSRYLRPPRQRQAFVEHSDVVKALASKLNCFATPATRKKNSARQDQHVHAPISIISTLHETLHRAQQALGCTSSVDAEAKLQSFQQLLACSNWAIEQKGDVTLENIRSGEDMWHTSTRHDFPRNLQQYLAAMVLRVTNSVDIPKPEPEHAQENSEPAGKYQCGAYTRLETASSVFRGEVEIPGSIHGQVTQDRHTSSFYSGDINIQEHAKQVVKSIFAALLELEEGHDHELFNTDVVFAAINGALLMSRGKQPKHLAENKSQEERYHRLQSELARLNVAPLITCFMGTPNPSLAKRATRLGQLMMEGYGYSMPCSGYYHVHCTYVFTVNLEVQ